MADSLHSIFHNVLCFVKNTMVMYPFWYILWDCCYSRSVISDSFATPWTVACQAPLSMEFSRHEYGSGLPFPSLGDLPNPGIELRSPTLQGDSLPSEPPGKHMNTGVGSLSLFQGIFLTQELNPGLLHCRQTLYPLSHQGSRITWAWTSSLGSELFESYTEPPRPRFWHWEDKFP